MHAFIIVITVICNNKYKSVYYWFKKINKLISEHMNVDFWINISLFTLIISCKEIHENGQQNEDSGRDFSVNFKLYTSC